MRIIGEIAIEIDCNYEIKIDLNQYNRRFYSTDEQVDTTRLNGEGQLNEERDEKILISSPGTL